MISSPAEELACIREALLYILEHPPQTWAIFAETASAFQARSKPQGRNVNSQLVMSALFGNHTALHC